MLKHIFQILAFILFGASVEAQPGNYISVKQRVEILENRNKLATDVDWFLDNGKQILTKYYHASPDFIIVTNPLGEIKTYYPSRNEVDYKQMSENSSKRNLIYYFVNNLTDNLGLADEGFTLVSNTFENQYYVTLWKAPSVLNGVESVKMVIDNGFPVYSEYKSGKKKILRKIYYSNYKDFGSFRLPMKIIEISFRTPGDSIISRTVFSDVKVSSTADNSYFDFKIPEDAKPIKPAENK